MGHGKTSTHERARSLAQAGSADPWAPTQPGDPFSLAAAKLRGEVDARTSLVPSGREKPGSLLRVHLHAYFRFAQPRYVRESSPFQFKGSHPNLSAVTTSAKGKQRVVGNQGLYFVQAAKIGSILSGGNTERFTGYLVNPDWVYHLIQGNKMTVERARQEFLAIDKHIHVTLMFWTGWRRIVTGRVSTKKWGE